MAILRTKRFDEILTSMKLYATGQAPTLSNYNVGSRIRTLFAAIAIKISEVYMKFFFAIKAAITVAVFEGFDFARRVSTPASGSVIFSRTTPAPGTITIPIGTIVATSSGIQFRTRQTSQLLVGQTSSISIPVEAVVAGAGSNVASSTVTVIISSISGIETVNNASGMIGGLDEETESERKARFAVFVNGLARVTLEGLKAGAISVPGVKNVSIVENDPSIGFIKIYIDDGTGAASASLISAVQQRIDGTDTTIETGYRGVGVVATVLAPTVTLVNVTVTIAITAQADFNVVKANVVANIMSYINNLQLGQDVIFAELMTAVAGTPFVTDATFTTPTASVAIAASNVARTNTITVTPA